MPQIPRYIRLIMLFDLMICGAFALPVVALWVIELINLINAKLGLGGGPLLIPEGANFFVNFAGLLGVAFNIMLLNTDLPKLHWTNIIARSGVVMLIMYHIIFSNLPALFVIFIGTEIAGGLATVRWLRGGGD
jgi:hypothetical protein